MNCFQAQELLGIYHELTDQDPRKKEVEQHLAECESCAEEYQIWKESLEWIEDDYANGQPEEEEQPRPISNQVMSQIYEADKWRTPISNKAYSLPEGTRHKLYGFIAFCIALFIVSFLYSIVQKPNAAPVPVDNSSLFGFHPAASFSSSSTDAETLSHTAVASLDSMIMEQIKFGQFDKSPDYWIVFSLLGLVCALLIMNWLSRTRS